MTPHKKTAVIVNPHASSGRARKKWPVISKRLEARIGPFTTRFTERPGHATLLARELLSQGFDLIVTAGGDGTFNEVANGFLDRGSPVNSEAVLGILPIATGGDFQRSLGIGARIEDAIEVIASGMPGWIDMGRVVCTARDGSLRERYFLNLVSFGMGGAVASRAKNFLSFLGGKVAFLWATFLVLLRYRGKSVSLFLDDSPQPICAFVTNIAVGNGQFHGGGMHPCPSAMLNDGLLDITVIDYMPFLRLVREIKILYSANVLRHPKVHAFRAAKIVAEGDPETLIEVDGEPLGALPLEITILPTMIKVLTGPIHSRRSSKFPPGILQEKGLT
ncbi:MAG TPA: diacylglycerol kinase family protein [Terriglobia bacterium]|nr:diacylglycerol kinase family protein [Terriglobia bacterium]